VKLRISEDTACIPSKTSYVDEDGWDKNGIYYFGEKPKKPINWKDYKKGSNKKMITLESYLAEDSLDEYGMFMQLDDAISGMVNNVDDDEIDEAVRYFERVAGVLGSKNRLSNVQCYFCNADWLNPSKQDWLRSNLKPLYKNKRYDSYVGTYNGKKFVVDQFSNNFDFTVYSTDENTIIDLIKDIEEAY
jgi:hypothetical protein